jgi:hypothetical protein
MLLLAVLLSGGCSTMRTVAPGDLQAALGRLQAGDSIAVRAADTWHENLTVAGVTDANIQAKNISSGEPVTFGRADVAEIKVRIRAPGKTVGLAAGIFFAVLGSGIPGLSL